MELRPQSNSVGRLELDTCLLRVKSLSVKWGRKLVAAVRQLPQIAGRKLLSFNSFVSPINYKAVSLRDLASYGVLKENQNMPFNLDGFVVERRSTESFRINMRCYGLRNNVHDSLDQALC